jgi:DNA-binding beta-propeller fold protein YncE
MVRMNFKPTSFACILLFALTVFPHGLVAQDIRNEEELQAQLESAKKFLGQTPDRGAVLFFLAATHALLREPNEAMARLRECVALKAGFDPVGEPAFAGLRDSKDFQTLTKQVHKDFPVVSTAQPAFVSTDKDLVPEGLAYSASPGVFYLSSLHLKKILVISRQGEFKDFVGADRYKLLPVLGIRVDPVDGSVWANSWLDNSKTELLHFDQQAALLGRFSLPEDGHKHGFNDLVVLHGGDVLLTDTADNKVYRFDAKTQSFDETRLARELLLPNGIALTDDESAIYIADQLGVLRLHLKSGLSAEVDPGPQSTLAGADGLYWHAGKLIAVQNGIGSPRIAVFQLSDNGLHVTKTTVVENRSKFTVLPTTGALDGDDFYFIVNSQIDNLNGERILDNTKLQPARIAKLHIP